MEGVQSFISNISFPKSLEEVLYFQKERGLFDVEFLKECSKNNIMVEWTAPKWTKAGDIAFFMHSKTSNSIISRLTTTLNNNKKMYDFYTFQLLKKSLDTGKELYNKYGGKIFALGKVTGGSFRDSNYELQNTLHWKSRIYAPIENVYFLKNPIDITEFSSFIYVSRQSAITPVFGKEFDMLKQIINSKNDIPEYLEESLSVPIPLMKINKDNWITVSNRYRHSFFLEIQFRTYYVDYLLEILGDKKKFYSECPCIKNYNTCFVDNVILVSQKYLPVEVKLNIENEKDIIRQVEKYCNVDKLVLDRKNNKIATSEKQVKNNVLIIDTNTIYWYNDLKKSIKPIFYLNSILTVDDIIILREKIVKLMC